MASLNEAERVPLWQEWLTRDISVFVAEIEGKIVGFAGGGPIREPLAAYDAELYTIYLLEEVQRRGWRRRTKLGIRWWIMLRDQIDYQEFCRRGQQRQCGEAHAGMPNYNRGPAWQ